MGSLCSPVLAWGHVAFLPLTAVALRTVVVLAGSGTG